MAGKLASIQVVLMRSQWLFEFQYHFDQGTWAYCFEEGRDRTEARGRKSRKDLDCQARAFTVISMDMRVKSENETENVLA